MGGREFQPVSINPQRPNETINRPDGSSAIIKWEVINKDLKVSRLSHAQIAEAEHVFIAHEEGDHVIDAQAGEETGVTRFTKTPAHSVFAAHFDTGGHAHDLRVLLAIGGNPQSAQRRASAIKARGSEEIHAVASRLAVQGRATGEEMYRDIRRIQEDRRLGKEMIATVTVTGPDGKQTQTEQKTREKTGVVMVPGVEVKPRSSETDKNKLDLAEEDKIVNNEMADFDAEHERLVAEDKMSAAQGLKNVRAKLAAMQGVNGASTSLPVRQAGLSQDKGAKSRDLVAA